MASFDFLVDTSPMASTMSGVSTHVTETTVAVAAMQAAVIAAEQDAANMLCADIDNGFYCLMQSQLSMKKTEYIATLRTRFLSLRELGKDLCSKQERMELDVARIQREYYKLFHSIDMSLDKQIQELDADAYKVADQRERLITLRHLKDVSEALTYARDISSVTRSALTAKMKRRTQRTLETVNENVRQNQVYRDRMQTMLSSTPVETAAQECIPVVYAQEASSVMPGVQVFEVQLPEGLDKSARDPISQAVSERVPELSGQAAPQEDRDRVRTEFQKLVSGAGLDPRIADVMMRLYEHGGYR